MLACAAGNPDRIDSTQAAHFPFLIQRVIMPAHLYFILELTPLTFSLTTRHPDIDVVAGCSRSGTGAQFTPFICAYKPLLRVPVLQSQTIFSGNFRRSQKASASA
jgi:hypothetical protein